MGGFNLDLKGAAKTGDALPTGDDVAVGKADASDTPVVKGFDDKDAQEVERVGVGDLDVSDQKRRIRTIFGNTEFKKLLMEAKSYVVKGQMIEPEHMALAVLARRGVDVEPLKAKFQQWASQYGDAPFEGTKFSVRTVQLMIDTSFITDTPSIDVVADVLLATPGEFATTFKTATTRAHLDALRNGGVQETAVTGERLPPPPIDQFEMLSGLGEDLATMAHEDRIKVVVGRDKDINNFFTTLLQDEGGNPIITGEAGVGKTALVFGAAKRIYEGNAPAHANTRIVSIAAEKLLTQCRNGSADEIFSGLAQEVERAREGEPTINVVIFIDEIHALMEDKTVANALKPFLSSGKLRICGATTTEEYKEFVEDVVGTDALQRRMTKLVLKEPDATETLQMLMANIERLQRFHGIEINAGAVKEAVDLEVHAEKLGSRCRPDSARKILDRAAAAVRNKMGDKPPRIVMLEMAIGNVERALQKIEADNASGMIDSESLAAQEELAERLERLTGDLQKVTAQAQKEEALIQELSVYSGELRRLEKADSADPAEVRDVTAKIDKTRKKLRALPERLFHEKVDAAAVAQAVADALDTPLEKLRDSGDDRYKEMGPKLAKKVVGQPHILDEYTKRIYRYRAGLKKDNEPIGVLLFAGMTGTGKTYAGRTVSKDIFGSEAIYIPMSETEKSHELAKWFGAPPGYVGHGRCKLADEIRARNGKPTVLLLDEIEKAHPDVFPKLMQLCDEGYITDSKGDKVDGTNLLIVMTTNLADQVMEAQAGDGKYHDMSVVKKALLQHIMAHPGLGQSAVRARIDNLNVRELERSIYDPHSLETMGIIADHAFTGLQDSVEATGRILGWTPEAKAEVVRIGMEKNEGGRGVKNAIAENIDSRYGEEIVEGRIKGDQNVVADFDAKRGFGFREMTNDELAEYRASRSDRKPEEKVEAPTEVETPPDNSGAAAEQ